MTISLAPSLFDPTTFDPAGWVTSSAVELWRWLMVRWPSLLAVAVAVVLLRVVVRLVYRAVWRRTVAGGRWLTVIPPRTLDPARYEQVARKLYDIALLAHAGRWRLVRPPIAFEIHATDGQLRHGLWLPAWVSPVTVAAELRRVWPGAVVNETDPPPVAGRRRVAYRLTPYAGHTESSWLVDDPGPRSRTRRGGEPDVDLGGVWAALGDVSGVALLQLLIRPASARQVARLASARQPGRPRRSGMGLVLDAVTVVLRTVLLGVIDVFLSSGRPTPSGSSRPGAGREPVSAVQREEFAEARAKHKARPHVSVSVRAYAADGTRKHARRAARSVLAGYSDTSRWLIPVRLWFASVVPDRWAPREHWLLMSAAELGVLAHLPADPALYGFGTAALHRAAPPGTARPIPERQGRAGSGWTRRGWTDPPDDEAGSVRTTPYLADELGDDEPADDDRWEGS